MVAQSVAEASLIITGIMAVCAVVPAPEPTDAMFEPDDPEEPPPHAVRVAITAPHTAKFNFLVSMSLSPLSMEALSDPNGIWLTQFHSGESICSVVSDWRQ
jgi:hypothetical protein